MLQSKESQIGFVYRFLDEYENIIYVGSTDSITRRMNEHFSNGHLPIDCYKKVKYIEYAKFKSRTEAYMFEQYEIGTLKPIYNFVGKNSEIVKLEYFKIINLPTWIRLKNNFIIKNR